MRKTTTEHEPLAKTLHDIRCQAKKGASDIRVSGQLHGWVNNIGVIFSAYLFGGIVILLLGIVLLVNDKNSFSFGISAVFIGVGMILQACWLTPSLIVLGQYEVEMDGKSKNFYLRKKGTRL